MNAACLRVLVTVATVLSASAWQIRPEKKLHARREIANGALKRHASLQGRGDYDYAEMDPSMLGGAQGVNLTNLVKHDGLVTIYTDPADLTSVYFDFTELMNKDIPMQVLASATWAQGTFSEDAGQRTVMHEPVDGTEDTMLEFGKSGDNTLLDVVQPRIGLRTSDVQAREALRQGAWTGWKGSMKMVEAAGDTESGRILVDASSFVINGFYVAGWGLADTMVSYRIRGVHCYENNILMTVAIQIQDQSGQIVPAVVSFSMIQLPQPAMVPRMGDDRLGFFTVDFLDVGEHLGAGPKTMLSDKVDMHKSWIQRFNTTKEIKFYVDYSVPSRWREYFKEGVESWNVAFQTIGKPDLVKAILPGTPEWPADYDPNDARYSTISWSFDDQGVYALGLAKVDPRSGEIMKSDIIVTNGWVHAWLQELDQEAPVTRKAQGYRREERKTSPRPRQYDAVGGFRAEYGAHKRGSKEEAHAKRHRKANPFLRNRGRYSFKKSMGKDRGEAFRVSPLTFAAAKNQMTDAEWEKVIGAGLRSVVMHETGHSLGLRHNFAASTGINEDCLRDKGCTQVNSVTTSCMDYMPANILQLQAGVENPDVFPPRIGSYDVLAIQYGYSEWTRPKLDEVLEFASRLPFCTDEDSGGDNPLCQVHDLGANPLVFYREQLNLLKKEQLNLLDQSVGAGESYTRYGEAALSIMNKAAYVGEMLATFVGGITSTHMHRGLSGEHPGTQAVKNIPLWQQKEAMAMLGDLIKGNTSALLPPPGHQHLLIAREGQLGTGSIDLAMEVRALQSSLLRSLTSPTIMARLYASESLSDDSFTVDDLLQGVEEIAWNPAPTDAGASVSWDLQSMLMRYQKETYLSRCSAYIPVEVLSKLLLSLKRTKKRIEDIQSLVQTGDRGWLLSKDGDDAATMTKHAYVSYMVSELSDINKPCDGQPSAQAASYSYDYYGR